MARLFFLALLLASVTSFCASSVVVQEAIIDNDSPISTLGDKWGWKDCGNPTDPVHIKSISISPDPPKPGQALTVTVSGTADSVVEDGAYADVSVKVGLIKILQKEFDLCEEARNANLTVQCPIEKGDYEVVHTVDLPKEIPPAPFTVQVQGYTYEDEDLICLTLTIDFTPRRRIFGWDF